MTYKKFISDSSEPSGFLRH